MANDPYIHISNQVERLVEEWLKYGKLIVAFDFDNTVFDYHGKGHTFDHVISQLQQLGKMGCHMICFTSCDQSRYQEIRKYLQANNIPCHGINTDSEIVPFKGRKIYYNVFYDDRAGLGEVYAAMQQVVARVLAEMTKEVKIDDERAHLGEICAYSGKPFLQGDWYYTNKYPAAFPELRSENDIIPDVNELMNLFKRK